MALTYGFYNSVDGDRKYDAIQISQMFDGVILDGVFKNYKDGFKVVKNSEGTGLIVKKGRAWFNHSWILNDANLPLPAHAPDPLYPRIDALCIVVSNGSRTNDIQIIQGIPQTNPVAPTLNQGDDGGEYPLAYIKMSAGSTVIESVTDTRGTALCPFVISANDTFDSASLQNSVNSLNTSLTNLTNNTIGNASNSLQKQITRISNDISQNVKPGINANAASISELNSTVYAQGNDIDALKSSMTSAQSEIESIKLGAFSNGSNSLNSRIADNSIQIQSANSRITANTAAINTNKGNIQSLQDQVNSIAAGANEWKSGDTFVLDDYITGGFVTSSGKSIRFSINTCRSIPSSLNSYIDNKSSSTSMGIGIRGVLG